MNSTQKHAYLIIAHNKFDQLQILLDLLDDPRNDIYLHVDKKSIEFDPESIHLQYAKLFVVDRISVAWGGDTLIACELILFKAAASGHYQYYHLISGMDLPLKTQDEIHAFFDANAGTNYIKFDTKANENKKFYTRTQHYHLFQNVIGRRKDLPVIPLKIIKKVFLWLQKVVKFRRKEFFPLYKGAQWVSITDDMVQFLLQNEAKIRKQFFCSYCADEVFLSSVAMSSPLVDTIEDSYYRCIDWERGSPYTYRKEDVPQLLDSVGMFGRKFDIDLDPESVHMIADYLKNKQAQ